MKNSIKTLKQNLFCLFNTVDSLISGCGDTLLNNFDRFILESDLNSFFKRILHGKQILFFYMVFYNFFFIYNNSKINNNTQDDNLTKRIFFTFFLLSSIILFPLIIYFYTKPWQDQVITQSLELENYLKLNRKELENNKCEECKITKVMRSFHCYYCKKCTSRFEFHSHWFNLCIGSQNIFFYLIILLATNFYIINSLVILIYHYSVPKNNPEIINDFQGKYSALSVWLIAMIFTFYKIGYFTYGVFTNALENLTDLESDHWRRIPYLWKNEKREFFNPFNKGKFYNLKEYYYSFKNDDSFVEKLGLYKVNSVESSDINQGYSIDEKNGGKQIKSFTNTKINSEKIKKEQIGNYVDLSHNECECLNETNNLNSENYL